MPSRRHSLQTGSSRRRHRSSNPYSEPEASARILDHLRGRFRWKNALFEFTRGAFWRPATVVRQGCHVFNGLDDQSCGGQRGDRGFPAGTRAFDADFNFFESKFRRAFGGDFGGALGSKGRRLTATLEPHRTRGGVTQSIAVSVGDRHDGVVERRLDMGDAPANVSSLLAFLALCHVCCQWSVVICQLSQLSAGRSQRPARAK